MTRGKKLAILSPIALLVLLGGWQGLRYWWYRGYSRGSRTGVIRKLSEKGSPVCKYFSGEMILIGSGIGQSPESWEFTVDDDRPTSVVVQKLKAAEKTAQPVTVSYRQDKGKWWACAPTEYFVTGVEQ
jgi:hypothetical protein